MKKGECLHGDAIPTLSVSMEYIKKELGEIKSDLKAHISEEDKMMHRIEEKFTKWMQESDNRFASKQTEKVVNSLLATIFMGMAATIIGFILKAVGLL